MISSPSRTRRQLGVWLVATVAVVPGSIGQAQGPAATPAVTEPAQRDGWWIRINPANEATHVYWRFGGEASRLSAPIAWIQGQSPAEGIDLPVEQRGLERVHVAALGMPPRGQVSFCLFFRDRGVALIQFTQEKTIEVSQGQSAQECVP
jgi:hypothetical protein